MEQHGNDGEAAPAFSHPILSLAGLSEGAAASGPSVTIVTPNTEAATAAAKEPKHPHALMPAEAASAAANKVKFGSQIMDVYAPGQHEPMPTPVAGSRTRSEQDMDDVLRRNSALENAAANYQARLSQMRRDLASSSQLNSRVVIDPREQTWTQEMLSAERELVTCVACSS